MSSPGHLTVASPGHFSDLVLCLVLFEGWEKEELAIVVEDDNEHHCLELEQKQFLFSVLVLIQGKSSALGGTRALLTVRAPLLPRSVALIS